MAVSTSAVTISKHSGNSDIDSTSAEHTVAERLHLCRPQDDGVVPSRAASTREAVIGSCRAAAGPTAFADLPDDVRACRHLPAPSGSAKRETTRVLLYLESIDAAREDQR
jgi:hypothetical protein